MYTYEALFTYFPKTKGIFHPYFPARKKAMIVAAQVCHLYGFGEVFFGGKQTEFTVYEGCLFAQSTAV